MTAVNPRQIASVVVALTLLTFGFGATARGSETSVNALSQLRIFEVTALEQKMVSAILTAGGITEFTAETRAVEPLHDPQGTLELALMPVARALEATGVINRDELIRFAPRVVSYYTKDGRALVASCYLYMYQVADRPDRVYLNSRQCNPIWKGISALPNGERVSNFFSGVGTLGGALEPRDANFIDQSKISFADIATFLRK